MPQPIALQQFQVSQAPSGVVHLVFDSPGRSMNVFSNAAIRDLKVFVAWLKDADVPGAVVSSGKPNAFCAGADLEELGVAYDMIVTMPAAERTQAAYDHFFVLSESLRGLETAGKPVAAAIGGLALGGGCELAMACHHRVVSRDPKAELGLPESLVGLLPGGGGTQRLPRLIGLAGALPILLEAGRLSGEAAIVAGLADQLCDPGQEIGMAEAWVLGHRDAIQPWDKDDWRAPEKSAIEALIAVKRAEVMRETQGLYPAPLAILDCLERGFPQPMDQAIRTEMNLFAGLVQRVEPRNMIRALFRGKIDYEKLRKRDAVPPVFDFLLQAVRTLHATCPVPHVLQPQLEALADVHRVSLSEPERRAADYILVTQGGLPAYLGGLFGR